MKNIFCLGAASLMLCACSEMSNPQVSYSEGDEGYSSVNVISSTIVSNPAQDPYSVENMSEALRKTALTKSRSATDSAEASQLSFEPNYLYVRFLAEGKKGAYELKKYDSSLVLFKHPLDYKPIKKPVVYKDPSLPDSIIPYFATVPVDYEFGPTKYEIIKELFLVEPDEVQGDNAVKGLAKKTSAKMDELGISLHEVEWNSLEMTGNLAERLKSLNDESMIGEKTKSAWSLFSSAKKLGGTLKFQDDYLGEQPLVGVRVTGGYSYYWREAHTDANGHFSIPEKWSFDIDYEANFDSDEFLLEDGHSFYGEDLEVEKNGKHSDWNQTFKGDTAKWCVVWTAAYQYWYGDNYGLKRPRQNTATNWSLDIEVYYRNKKDYYDNLVDGGESSVGNYDGTLGVEDICILAYGQTSKQIYSTTIHEVAHSSHYWNTSKSLWSFFKLPSGFRNTYTRGVEDFFTQKKYGSPANNNYDKTYTAIFGDLIDGDKDYKKKNGVVSSGDAVKGFEITELEKGVFNSSSLNGLKNYLMEKYPSGVNGRSYTKDAMNNLFNYWTK